MVEALVNPRSMILNDRLPVGNPSGSFTTIYELFIPFTPVIGPTFSTGKSILEAFTEIIDELGFCCLASPRADVNRMIRVCPSMLKLCEFRMENGPRTKVTESSAAALFVPSSLKITGAVGGHP